MIKTLKPREALVLGPEIERLIADYGRWDVLGAAVLAVVRRPRRRPDAGELTDRMRRDIGLPPVDEARDWRLLR